MTALESKARTHRVEPRPGYFAVTSGSSGKVYCVTPHGDGSVTCSCEWGTRQPAAGPCSHILSVREFARSLPATDSLPPQPTAVQPANPPSPAAPAPSAAGGEVDRLFAGIDRSEAARKEMGIDR